MGAALQPHLPSLQWYVQPAVWHVTVDQNWAVNIAEYRRGHGDLGRFLGGGFVMVLIWTASTLLGHLAAGGVLSDPTAARRLGLDFVGIAVFVVVAAILFRGKRDVAPWSVAIATALAAKWAGRRQLVHRDRRAGRRPVRRLAADAHAAMTASPENLRRHPGDGAGRHGGQGRRLPRHALARPAPLRGGLAGARAGRRSGLGRHRADRADAAAPSGSARRQPPSPPDGQAVSRPACSRPSAPWPWPGGPASAESVSVGC